MFREKCIIIMYRANTDTGSTCTGSYYMSGRTSYVSLFIAAIEHLKEEFDNTFTITNIIKL